MKITLLLKALCVYTAVSIVLLLFGEFIYLVAALMIIAVSCIIYFNRKRVLKHTRWANANSFKAQALITLLQLALIVAGLYGGFNLSRAGFNLSFSLPFIFGACMVAGFLSVPFLPKKKLIALPNEISKNHRAFLAISISFYMLTVFTGNQVETLYPDSFVTGILNNVDRQIFKTGIEDPSQEFQTYPVATNHFGAYARPVSSIIIVEKTIVPPRDSVRDAKEKLKAEKEFKKIEKKKAKLFKRLQKRLGLSAALTAGAVVLIVLLVITSCAGFCLIIGGFSGGSAGLIPLGALVLAGSIYGIVQVKKNDRKNK